MEQKRKTMAIRAAAAAAGISAAMFVGMMYPGGNKSVPVNTGSVKTAAGAVPAAAVDTAAEDPAEKLTQVMEYRKADIHEYKMASVSNTPLVPLSSKNVKDEDKKEKAPDEDKPEEENAEEATTEDFTVVIPEESTEVSNNKPDLQNYGATRSVSSEYYTVNDLISGGTVTMNAHEMLCRMVFNEIGALWDEDAIKAQVVAAYTHLRYNDSIGRVPTIALKPGYPEKIEKCVYAVEGQAVFYNGSVINATYAASTAGYSADSSEIFGVSYPYLTPVVSEYDSEDPNWGVVTAISPDTIRKAFKDKYGFVLSDNYKNWFDIRSMHAGKYVGNISIDGGRMSVSGAEMRTLLKLRSSAFEISYSGGMFSFTTYGYGHGVGMSQWGAKLYADHGWTYDQILRHYYVGTVVSLTAENSNAVERGISLNKKKNDSSAAEKTEPVKSEPVKTEPVKAEEKSEPEAAAEAESADSQTGDSSSKAE